MIPFEKTLLLNPIFSNPGFQEASVTTLESYITHKQTQFEAH